MPRFGELSVPLGGLVQLVWFHSTERMPIVRRMDSLVSPAPGTNVIYRPAPWPANRSSVLAQGTHASGALEPKTSRWFGLTRIPVVGRDRGAPSVTIKPATWAPNSAPVPVSAPLGLPTTVGQTRTASPAIGTPHPADEVCGDRHPRRIRRAGRPVVPPRPHGARLPCWPRSHGALWLPCSTARATDPPTRQAWDPDGPSEPDVWDLRPRRVVVRRGRMPTQVLPPRAVVAVPVRPGPAGVTWPWRQAGGVRQAS